MLIYHLCIYMYKSALCSACMVRPTGVSIHLSTARTTYVLIDVIRVFWHLCTRRWPVREMTQATDLTVSVFN